MHIPIVRPTAPVHVTVANVSSTSVQLLWQQPLDDGGAPLTNYLITYHSSAEDHMTISTNNAEVTSVQLDDLAPYTAYQIQVSAENLVGIGPPSDTVNVMTLIGGTYVCVYVRSYYKCTVII